jgi:hypothetical protein
MKIEDARIGMEVRFEMCEETKFGTIIQIGNSDFQQEDYIVMKYEEQGIDNCIIMGPSRFFEPIGENQWSDNWNSTEDAVFDNETVHTNYVISHNGASIKINDDETIEITAPEIVINGKDLDEKIAKIAEKEMRNILMNRR